MVTALKVTNYLGETLSINPFDPESSGFLITDIKGITPVEADINFTSITTNDGGLYNSARIGTRNITMKLVYLPTVDSHGNATIEATRLLSYKYFPVKKEIKLEFTTENRQAEITGYVESNDINIFTKLEYSAVSIICPDPYFYSTGDDGEIDVVFAGTAPKFRFAFPTNCEVTSNNPTKFIMGDIQTFREQVLTYNGDSEIGMEIILRALGSVGDVTIYNRMTNESMFIDAAKIATLTGYGIIAGDVITIYTYRGNKKISLLRNGVTTNILNCLDKNTTWLQVRKGDNVFAFSATSGAIDLQVEIKSRTMYEGL